MLFDSYIMVDWSAVATRKRGADSIWWSLGTWCEGRLQEEPPQNPATRAAAMATLTDLLVDLSEQGKRVLIGFDFPFGYPAGFAERLALNGDVPWRATWQLLADMLDDAPDNANNRFDVAAALNERLARGSEARFWGHPHNRSYRGLGPRKPAMKEGRRRAEQRVRQAKTVWQLNGAGSVGGQVLTGLPRLLALRDEPRLAGRIAVWPFETGLRAPAPRGGDVVIAEVYPSLVPPDPSEAVKDAGQVRAVVQHLATHDADGTLADLFTGGDLSADDRMAIETEEAWILGVAV